MHAFLGRHWSECDFAVVDVEGNGQTPQEIIELAVIPIRRGTVEERQHEWMIHPERPVTAQATRIHGISNAALAAKPRFSEIADEVMDALGECAIVGHNVAIDARLLQNKLLRWRPPLLLDTLRLARRILPGRSSYSLASLATELEGNLVGAKLHRASVDAYVTAHLFLALVRLLDRDCTLSLGQLQDVAGLRTGDLLSDGQQTLF
jgi:DNA polymerase III epsilon subunit family exonuclease